MRRLSTVNLLVLISLNQLFFIMQTITFYKTSDRNETATVLSLPLQSVFPDETIDKLSNDCGFLASTIKIRNEIFFSLALMAIGKLKLLSF